MFCIVMHHLMVFNAYLLGYTPEIPYSAARAAGGGGYFVIYNANTQMFESVKFWAYNSPWTIAISILIFTCFSKIEIQNAFINRIASCTLIVYLFHSNLVMHFFNKAVTDYMTNYMGMLIGIFMASLLIYIFGTLVGFFVTKLQQYIVKSMRKIPMVNSFFEYIPSFIILKKK